MQLFSIHPFSIAAPPASAPSQLLRAKADHCTAAVASSTFHLICIGRDREVHPFLFGAKLWSTFLARHSSLPAAGSLGSLSACQHLELRSKPDATTAAVCASAENLLRQASQSSASLTWRPGTRGAEALCEFHSIAAPRPRSRMKKACRASQQLWFSQSYDRHNAQNVPPPPTTTFFFFTPAPTHNAAFSGLIVR